MKRLLFSVVALLALSFAHAQEETPTGSGFKAGDVLITGSAGFGTSKTGEAKTTTFNFTPRVGYFVNNNIAIGVALGYSSQKDEGTGYYYDPYGNEYYGFEQKRTSFDVGAFGRYYFTPANKFSIFGQLGASYQFSKYEYAVDYGAEEKTNGFVVAVAPGINYFISSHFALEATFGILSYTTSKPDYDAVYADETSTNSFDFGLNFSNINFGLVYKF
ncbi:porin family protein [Flavobacterium zepuense]|uniref:Porin family protein n=1 Tax=Flavobacterium zepuense TaxID=2593302 RepID=A0A552V2T3_9FLAO|nr:outer membrane beta-barrel protein [Flavobacterium zepuense]TRW24773.1 porin family protein [Flavobacterium zepuense]